MSEPQVRRRDQQINEMLGGNEPVIPTKDDEAAITEEHGEVEDTFEASKIIDTDDIGSSQVFESALPATEQTEEDVPHGVSADEQPETVEEVDSAATAERMAQARLREINHLRRKGREMKAQLDNQAQMLQEMKNGQEVDPSVLPEDLQDDRAAQYFNQKFEQLRKPLEEFVQGQATTQQVAQRNQETTRYASESAQAYSQHTQDWGEAYQFAKQSFAQENGITDGAQLDFAEHALVREWMEQGLDPADAVYEYALSKGYAPGTVEAAASPSPAEQPERPVPTRVRRIKRGVQKGGSISEARGEPSVNGRLNELTREQFFAQTSLEDRQRLFQLRDRRGRDIGNEAFQQLATTGKINKRYLDLINSVHF